jgi:SAM-dependent methyltransferase
MSESAPALTREQVILGYRLLLGRYPESEAVIEAHRASYPDLPAFARAVEASPEFRARQRSRLPELPPPLDAPRQEGDVTVDAGTLQALLTHTGAYWTRIGKTAPHWSVLTEDRFTPERIAQNRAAFFASGEWDVQVLAATLARIGRAPEEFAHCVEYGCGVGRATVALAARFQRVTALDISQPHLDQAARELAARGLGNVKLARVTAERLMPAGAFDFWYSRIVLQHNPPPVILAILNVAFRRLEPGGVAMFQVPTWIQGYRFSARAYLAGAPGTEMEMHAVPQAAVFELAARHGLIPRDIREDNALVGRPGEALSNSFTFEKRG